MRAVQLIAHFCRLNQNMTFVIESDCSWVEETAARSATADPAAHWPADFGDPAGWPRSDFGAAATLPPDSAKPPDIATAPAPAAKYATGVPNATARKPPAVVDPPTLAADQQPEPQQRPPKSEETGAVCAAGPEWNGPLDRTGLQLHASLPQQVGCRASFVMHFFDRNQHRFVVSEPE